MNTLAQEIINNKIPCVFVSPHFDDAFLSCGSLIADISGKTNITIINVFTKAHDDGLTLSAKKALSDAKYSNGIALYQARKKEDAEVYAHYKVTIVNLGLYEALFRRKKEVHWLGKLIPEFAHIYPTYRWHMHGQVHPHDPARTVIYPAIRPYLINKPFLFIPYGIGNHVDHTLTRLVCEKEYERTVYYADVPYTMRNNFYGKAIKGKKVYRYNTRMDVKTKMLQLYKTQFEGLFPGGIVPDHQEVYYR